MFHLLRQPGPWVHLFLFPPLEVLALLAETDAVILRTFKAT